MDLILKPVRVATSKPARQTYLNTALFMITSSVLFGFAVFAYILLYYNYVPQISIERVIHLQYGDGHHPYGITSLDTSLVSQQAYDITLTLHVPRSPLNLDQGNFMLSLSLLSPNYKPITATTTTPDTTLTPSSSSTVALSEGDIILSSRRPAILTYTSRLISLSERLLSLPLYVLGLKHESEILHIPMAESASFSRGRKNIPGFAMLELQSGKFGQAGQEIQVYAAKIAFKARFGGLRWWMYNYRVLSFLLFTSAFWISELLFTAFGWLVVRSVFSTDTEVKKELKGEDSETRVKKEEDDSGEEVDLSDTPRTFPTYGRQAPLKYESSGREGPQVKDEDSEEYAALRKGVLAEADDEDEDDEEIGGYRGITDSGIGTSFSEGGEAGGVKRRKSRGGRN